MSSHESTEEQCQRARETFKQIMQINPAVHIEVFIHKIDTDMYRDEDRKIRVLTDIQEGVDERDLSQELGIQFKANYYLTSIYDHTIYEAFSKVIQKLLP